jgi:hypothetical protein
MSGVRASQRPFIILKQPLRLFFCTVFFLKEATNSVYLLSLSQTYGGFYPSGILISKARASRLELKRASQRPFIILKQPLRLFFCTVFFLKEATNSDYMKDLPSAKIDCKGENMKRKSRKLTEEQKASFLMRIFMVFLNKLKRLRIKHRGFYEIKF